MTRCIRRAVLFLAALSLLLLCGCQPASTPPILPDPPPAAPQWKDPLLSALNQYYKDSYKIPGHFIRSPDNAAETILLYIQQNCGNDISRAKHLLTENDADEYERVNCAAAVISSLAPKSNETYQVGYAVLPADMLENGIPKNEAAFMKAAQQLFETKRLLVLSDSFSVDSCEQVGFAAGVIGDDQQLFIVAVFLIV